MIKDPKIWAGLLGVLVGGVLGFALGEVKEWLARRRRSRAHWLALRAEADFCREQAQAFLGETPLVMAPLYRLPTLTYSHSFPVLLADGAPNDEEVRTILQFFCEVETLNRGLDQANEASGDDDTRLRQEFGRNRLKAERLLNFHASLRAVLDYRAGTTISRQQRSRG